jgi:uncharacterized repeat protein (TIGR02543 family)
MKQKRGVFTYIKAALLLGMLALSACPAEVYNIVNLPFKTYTVTFNSNGGIFPSTNSGTGYTETVVGGGMVTEPSGITKTGYTLEGWYKEAAFTTKWNFGADRVTADIILYARWTQNPAGTFTVTFNSNGGTPVPADQNVAGGNRATEPSGVSKAGYTLEGWYTEAAFTTRWNFDTDTVTGGVTLYAKWTQNPAGTFTVTFNSNGGSVANDQLAANGGIVNQPGGVVRAGYTLEGWYKDAACTIRWDFGMDTVTGGITLYAKWTQNAPGTFTVTFNSNGGSAVTTQLVTSGGTVVWAYSTKEDYTLEGWYKEAAFTTRWNFGVDTVMGNITLYAKWGEKAGKLMTRTVSEKEIRFRYVPAGSFLDNEHKIITIPGYWLGETEITQELFEAVMGINPSYFRDSPTTGETQVKRPVEQVSFYAAIAFCNKLSLLDGKGSVYGVREVNDWANLAYSDIPTTNNATWNEVYESWTNGGYRLPSQEEWVWAAMGADKTVAQPNLDGFYKRFAGSTGSNDLGDYVWEYNNSENKTHEVGKKMANELNLYDMSGNVSEWVFKRPFYDPDMYPGIAFWPFRGESYDFDSTYMFDLPSIYISYGYSNNGGLSEFNGNYNIGFRVLCPE